MKLNPELEHKLSVAGREYQLARLEASWSRDYRVVFAARKRYQQSRQRFWDLEDEDTALTIV